MADTSGQHHGIDYVELSVTDMEAAKRFYGAAFGWSFNDYGPGYAGYVDGARGAREAGGLRLVDAVAPGGPLVILFSRDLEASRDAARAAGAAIVADIFEFPGGRRFELEDPFGTRLGVWSPS
ncbi:MAG: VOC family protein [Sandaracinaceae bacterium]|nr:VOC family protein [Sandaracinaceae bacterium]